MPFYSFAFDVEPTENLMLSIEDALFMVGCTDCIILQHRGKISLEFERLHQSVGHAVTAAWDEVELAGLKVINVREIDNG